MYNYSVLLSVYAKENPDYLRESINSMLNQTHKSNDFIIVADGLLTPELENVIEEFISIPDSYIRVMRLEQNVGLGAALNYGLKYCKNSLVARMDSDDISFPERCEKQVIMFEEHPDLDIVGAFLYEFSETNSKRYLKTMPISQYEIVRYCRKRNPFNHPTVMYKKESVLKSGGYTEGKRGEDYALFSQMMFEGYKGYNIPEPLLYYRTVPNQYRRRTSVSDVKAVVDVVIRNYKRGYIKVSDMLTVIFLQTIGVAIPKKIGSMLFKKNLSTGNKIKN